MQIRFLGTGTSQGIPVIGCHCDTCTSSDPRDKRLRCSLLIYSETTSVVIDVGPDFRAQMLASPVESVDAIFLTHEHNDHVIGLDDLRPIIFKSQKAMKVYAEQRVINELTKRFSYAFTEATYPGAPRLDVTPINPGDILTVGDISLQAFRVHHGTIPILGFRTDRMAYMTDVNRIDDQVIAELRGIDTLVISALRHRTHHAHFSLGEAIDIIRSIHPERAYLIHMGHAMGPTATWEVDLPDGIYPAYDQLTLEV